MSIARRCALRLMWAVCVLAALAPAPRSETLADAGQTVAAPSDNVAIGLPPEVRLRRLHLVRPDLIPYPIAYEVVC